MTDDKFARVGTSLFKMVDQPSMSGDFIKKRILWNNETLRQDYGKDFIATVPKYDGFYTVPNHIHYQPVIGTFLNLYEPTVYKPQQGNCALTLSFVKHIFGEQNELGLDYIQLLHMHPIQKLPILLLVSQQRNTGKSTFLDFLKVIFKGNMTFNTNEDFRSQFNSDWTGKLIIAVDEALLNRREDSERLKNLSTALSHKVEAKGKDRNEISFFGKFILCSNNESNPVTIDPGETRYWVRRITPFGIEDTMMLHKLIVEIPHFLFFLQNRILTTKKESRMWFAPKLVNTPALQKIIRSNRNRLEMELSELFLDIMETTGKESISFCPTDLIPLLMANQVKSEIYQLRRIIQDDWKLEPAPNSLTYQTYQYNYNSECRFSPIRRIGRYYTVTKELLL